MVCPSCNFKRTSVHTNPSWECPNCKKAYNKHKSKTKFNFKKSVNSDEASSFTVMDLLLFPLGVFIFSLGYKNINTGYFDQGDMFCLFIGFLLVLPTLIKLLSIKSSSGGDGGGDGGCGGGGE
ncbi:hypothetical protein SAMN02745724_03590 [Pseudoalteromonas denitrificans DSM 6059]|uniref:Uncharacterized protein n=2 Tax=Pseudoalteromonas TaxID=53246 RepID=A0A1I1Q192_9GAMM|nr:hypothetical protein SAMN02745724_03590 [Pseudoalteromonas denitrificans DSM 6059]